MLSSPSSTTAQVLPYSSPQHQRRPHPSFLYNTTAICIGPELGYSFKALELGIFSIEGLCKVGLLLAVVVPKGYVEGRIVYMVVTRGVKVVEEMQ